MTTPTRAPYVPPTGDEPLDEIERALVRALVSSLLAEIREAEAAQRPTVQPIGDADGHTTE